MDKQYRYTLRKTTLGLASVAIAAFLAGQAPTALAAEDNIANIPKLTAENQDVANTEETNENEPKQEDTFNPDSSKSDTHNEDSPKEESSVETSNKASFTPINEDKTDSIQENEVIPEYKTTYGITFDSPDDSKFESVEFYKLNDSNERVDFKMGWVPNQIKNNEKLYAKVVMKPGWDMGATQNDLLTKDSFNQEIAGEGDNKHFIYSINGIYLPSSEASFSNKTFRFNAVKHEFEKETPPAVEPQPEEPKYKVESGGFNEDSVSEFTFTAYDPDNPTNEKVLNTRYGKIDEIPEGWKLKGKIVMKENKYLMNLGNPAVAVQDMTLDVTDNGINNSFVTYTFDNVEIKGNMYLSSFHTTAFNHVTYDLNGGTWTDENLKPHQRLHWSDSLKQAFITPERTVYKPTDPVREGYKFIGWKFSSDIGKANGVASAVGNEYRFEETDINTNDNFVQAGIVHLTAQWKKDTPWTPIQPAPVLEVPDKTIKVGDDFRVSDMIPESEDPKTIDIETPEGFDKNKPGKYTITFIKTNEYGAKITKTATLTVVPKLTPLITAELEVRDIEVWEGDDVDLEYMIKNYSKGKVEIIEPEDYAPNEAGNYEITFKLIAENGMTVTKKANLKVKKRLTPLTPAPTLGVEDKTIKVGDDFRISDMITNGGIDNVEFSTPEGFDQNKPGTYEITFTKTNEDGIKVIKKATLTVVPGLTPLITAKLEVKDLEIWEGDEANLELMLQNYSEGKVEIIEPENYTPDQYGTYQITFKLTADNGMTITKTANLKVKKRLTPLEPAPGVHKEVYRTHESFEVEVIFDPNLDAGQMVVEQEGQDGIKEITKNYIVKDGKVILDKTEENQIQVKQNKIVRVGTRITELENLKEYGVVIVNYVDEEGLPIHSSLVNTVKLFNSNYDTTPNKLQTIEFNGKTYELVRVENDEEGIIDKALTQVTYVYKLKEGTTPEEPEVPGETPEEPETPGETPEKPETPGETPEEPGKPGEDKPNKPGEKDPEDSSKPGADHPGSNNSSEKPNTPSRELEGQVDKADTLPETGEEMTAHIFGAAALSILSGLGLVATKGRKEEE